MTVFEKSRLLTGMLLLAGVAADAQADVNAIDSYTVVADEAALTSVGIKNTNWGKVVAPVYGTSEPRPYQGAELFAGPNKKLHKWGDATYYHGVLPNGRIVRPAGTSVQIGMNPLGARLTPDGKFLITSNDDERDSGYPSQDTTPPTNIGGYSLSVIDTSTKKVVSQITAGKFFIGLQVTSTTGPTGPYYTVWASGGGENNIKLFNVSSSGEITALSSISIPPFTSANAGFVSNYKPDAAFDRADMSGNKPPVPSGFDRKNGAQTTFPAGSALSPDGQYLYVACNGDNSLAMIDTASRTVVKQIPVGYFPYDVEVNADGTQVFVSNWGITEYKFANPTYDQIKQLTGIQAAGKNEPDGYYVPKTDTDGKNPKTSSVSLISIPEGDATKATLLRSYYQGEQLDELYQVGDTHPTAVALVGNKNKTYLYVAKANSDSIGLIDLSSGGVKDAETKDGNKGDQAKSQSEFDLAPVKVGGVKPEVHGAYPNAMVVSPDKTLVYVAEAGLNTVAVLDTKNPGNPKLIGRIPTGWYPTALEISRDGNTLYVVNAKGIGEDLSFSNPEPPAPPSKTPSGTNIDSNYIFGTVQIIDLRKTPIDNGAALANNFKLINRVDDSVVPVGGNKGSSKIKHVFFILHENKTFDSMLGSVGTFGTYASTTFNYPKPNPDPTFSDPQYTTVALNTQLLASKFAVGVNYYSDAEESDAGHQFAASGTATDYTEKTLLVKSGRGLLVNKNFESEDYPEAGYIFNNAARNGVSFKDYGALIRIVGTDTGTSTPTTLNDPTSGNAGYPTSEDPLTNIGDVGSSVEGLGQSYFMRLPILAVLGGQNPNGEKRLDHNYPGYNFNISDQRRALEFCKDFKDMIRTKTLPQFLYIYQPNDHTGGVQAKNVPAPTAAQQVADGDVALGMAVNCIMQSPVYYDSKTGEGSAIFVTYDDAQATLDHIHPHRTPVLVIGPYAKPGKATRHYTTASIVKTEELLLGLPPNNLGDLFATDLRDMFQSKYNGIKATDLEFIGAVAYKPSEEGRKIWALVEKLNTSAPDRDSHRLGMLARLSMTADRLHDEAASKEQLGAEGYVEKQKSLYQVALATVSTGAPRDDDGGE